MNQLPALLLSNYRDTQKRALLIGRIIVIAMLGCLAAGVVQLGQRVLVDWRGGYLVILAIFIAFESMLVREQTEALEPHQRLLFHTSEWVAIAVVVKLLLYLLRGPAQVLADLALWERDFLGSFFTVEYVMVLTLLAVVWGCSRAYSGELKSLYRSQEDAGWEDLGKLQNILHQIRENLASRVFMVGAAVVTLAVFARLPANPVLTRAPAPGSDSLSPLVNVFLYAILALLLLSQTQFALLQTRWLWLRIPVRPGITRRWIVSGMVFFLALALLAFILPHQYTLGIFDTLRYVIGFLTQAFSLLLVLVALPFTFCMSLFSFIAPPNTKPLPTALPPTPQPVPPTAPVPWLEFARSLIFWVIFLGAIFLAMRYYLAQNATLWENIRRFPLVHWLSGAWRAFRDWFKRANRQIAQAARQQVSRLFAPRTAASRSVLRRIDLARLDPRARVIYLYLSLVESAGQHGVPRRPSQTPSQYEQRLENAAPEIEAELHDMTAAFIEARYTRHPVGESLSELISRQFEHIKAVFRSRN